MRKNVNFIIILIVIFLASLFIKNLLKTDGDTVLIYHNNELVESVSLSEDNKIIVGGTNTIVTENGYVYMQSATCPDKLCVHTGKINDNSRDIICLPNKVRVSVTKKSAIDAVTN